MATQRTMSVSSHSTAFRTKEGTYTKGQFQYCRETRKPHSGRELAPVSVSFVSCKDKEGQSEWIAFNSAREFYFYPFYGIRKCPDLTKPADKRTYKSPTVPVCHDFNLMTRSTEKLDLVLGFSTGPLQYVNPIGRHSVCAFNDDGSIDKTRVTCLKWVPGTEHQFVSSHRSGNLYVWSTAFTGKATGPMHFTPHSEVQDATISTIKTKHKSPLLFRWSIGHGAINNFAFSLSAEHIAVASQDGFLRIYNFEKQEFHSRMRSYFGGLLCVCWSPDGRYVVTGGEDDLVTVWSFHHKRVVARGEGHQSYVTAVAFDPYTTILPESGFSASTAVAGPQGNEEALVAQALSPTSLRPSITETSSAASSPFLGRLASEAGDREGVAYRLGSVGQDAQLCLWDLSEDALKIRRPFSRSRSRPSRMLSRPQSMVESPAGVSVQKQRTEEGQEAVDRAEGGEIRGRVRSDALDQELHKPLAESAVQNGSSSKAGNSSDRPVTNHTSSSHKEDAAQPHGSQMSQSGKSEKTEGSESQSNKESQDKEHSPSVSDQSTGKKEKRAKKNKNGKKHQSQQRLMRDPVKRVMRFVGITGANHNGRREVSTFETCNSDDIALKMHEVNLIEPLVAERVSQERLSDLVFREDCIVVVSYEGLISLWVRPGEGDEAGGGGETGGGGDGDHGGQGENEMKSGAKPTDPEPSETHPGLNSPRPGGGPSSPLKQTTV